MSGLVPDRTSWLRSWKLGRIFGVDLQMHPTFLLLPAWIAWVNAGDGSAAAVGSVLLVLATFTCIIAHEYGHVLVARRFGIGTDKVMILPIGGLAMMEREPKTSREELLITLAGPMVNIAIVLALVFLFRVPLDEEHLSFGDPLFGFWSKLAAINLVLAAFNLLPIFPMDGGRLLRATLALMLSRRMATILAASLGILLSIGLIFAAFHFSLPVLGIVATVILLTVGGELYSALVDRSPPDRLEINEFDTLLQHDGPPLLRSKSRLGTIYAAAVKDTAAGRLMIGGLSSDAVARDLESGRICLRQYLLHADTTLYMMLLGSESFLGEKLGSTPDEDFLPITRLMFSDLD